jgi:hypothetical protein
MNIIGDDTSIHKGALLIIDDCYYYVDYEEIGVTDRYTFSPDKYAELPAYRITDPNLVAKITDGEELFYINGLSEQRYKFKQSGIIKDNSKYYWNIYSTFSISRTYIRILFNTNNRE